MFCDVATRLPTGRYRVNTKTVGMPPSAFDPNGETTTFGAHIRPDPDGDPTQLVKCVIPNTAAALARLEKLYGKTQQGSSARNLTVAQLGAVPSHASRIQITDATAMIVDGAEPGCEAFAVIGCGGDDPVDPADPGIEPTEGPPPTEPDIPAFSLSPDPGYVASAVTTCYGQTDRPHLSTTFGFFGRTNVHARTFCTGILPITVGVRLERSKCFWFYCWWGTVDVGFDATVGTRVEAVANESCHKGWYIAYGYHTAVWLEGPGSARTANSAYLTC